MLKIKTHFQKNYCLYVVLIIYSILSIIAIKQLGLNYSLGSDDLSYINSGIIFYETQQITMHGVISAQIMPGMTFLISAMCAIFGKALALMVSLKILWILMGGISLIFLYKTIKLFSNQFIAAISTLFLLLPDYILANNIILTETPFIMLLMILIYYSFLYAKEHKISSYIMIIISFICCLFLRPNIGLYPIFLFIYLLLKKHDLKNLIKKGAIAGVIVILALAPWIYRNYKAFDRFIPLTYGMGNPLLLGTYQGIGYPLDEELDYQKNVYDKLPKEMKKYIENPEIDPKMTYYYKLEYDGLVAKYRMQEWWKNDKKAMLKSYLYCKPKIMFLSAFYWEKLYNIQLETILLIRKVEFILFIIAILTIVISKKHLRELFFILGIYGYHIVLYSYSFAFERYAITLYPLKYIVIGLGITIIYDYIRRGKNEKSINNSSSI